MILFVLEHILYTVHARTRNSNRFGYIDRIPLTKMDISHLIKTLDIFNKNVLRCFLSMVKNTASLYNDFVVNLYISIDHP